MENWGTVDAEVSLHIYTPRSNSRALVYHIIYVTSPLLTLGVLNAYVHAQATRVCQVICTFTLGAAVSTCGAQGWDLCLRGHWHPKRLDHRFGRRVGEEGYVVNSATNVVNGRSGYGVRHMACRDPRRALRRCGISARRGRSLARRARCRRPQLQAHPLKGGLHGAAARGSDATPIRGRAGGVFAEGTTYGRGGGRQRTCCVGRWLEKGYS